MFNFIESDEFHDLATSAAVGPKWQLAGLCHASAGTMSPAGSYCEVVLKNL
jgi:hypothetical protein